MQNGDINHTKECLKWISQSNRHIVITKKGCQSTPFFIILATNYLSNFLFLNTHLKECICKLSKGFNGVFYVTMLLLSSFLLKAQSPEPVFKRYTVDDGLPSSMVYHSFQDSKGYIWFATANGVSRYNGYVFENFDIQSGLVDNDVFEIYEDYKGRIWFIPMSGNLCYYENGKIISYKYNNKIKECIPVRRGPIKCSFYVDSLDYVYLSLKEFNRFSISPEGILKLYEEDNKDVNLEVTQLSNSSILVSNPDNRNKSSIVFHGLYQNFTLKCRQIFDRSLANPHHLFFLSAPDSSIICCFYETLFKIKKGKIVYRKNYHQDIIWMSIDDCNNLWVAPIGGGAECYANCNIEERSEKTFLDNYKITSVQKDKEGAYWFSSLNDGVFYSPDINMLNYTKEYDLIDDRINTVNVNRDGVYIGYEFGFVDLLKKDGVVHINSPIKGLKNLSVRRFYLDSLSNRVWICSIVGLYWMQENRVRELGLAPSNLMIFPKSILRSINHGYWMGATRGLVKIENDKIVYESYLKNDFAGLVYDLVEDQNGVVWLCTINGLWKYSEGHYTNLGVENPLFSQTNYSIIINPRDSSLWIGTNGAGIVVKGKNKVYQITKENGLISNSVLQLYYSKNSIWVATRQGLSRIVLNNVGFSVQNFTQANGLPTNQVSSVCEYNNIVYVGTSKGLVVFNKDQINECMTPPSVIISKVKVNNRQIDLSFKKVEFSYDQNSLNFDFVGFVYRNGGKVNYRYRMLGVDTVWVQTQTPNCLYNRLTNGEYRFEVEAQSYNGVWSSEPASFSFIVHPPFWKRTWFLVIGSILFSGILFLVFRARINAINRRNDLLQNINLYKQQSLRQQMNPHFIFNTLNSIQLYILERDPISSHKYLTKFARLMRMTLDNSLNSTIPLRDEIEALKLYLDLEKLRLEGRFEYSIDFGSDESLLDYKVPTLLIQPFVENAIWHGITLKQDQTGWVKITLADNGNSIHCTIEDNGIGREMANTIRSQKNKRHTSRGSQITQQRIDLLSLMYKEKFNIYYEDLLNEQGMPGGTKVFITIPKEINVNFQM